MNVTIRHEQPNDYRIAEEVTREAFWNLYSPGASEHYLVHTLRKHPDFMPELSFVIELDGRLVGSIFYTRSKLLREHGSGVDVVSFGPVSIHPDFHRKGLGRALITHSIRAAKDSCQRAIVIGGFRYHYEPYGFVGAKKYGIAMPDGKYYTGIMALPLFEGALDDAHGRVHFSAALYPDMSGLDAYDATFPEKEKRVLPCQEEFTKASTEIDTRVSF